MRLLHFFSTVPAITSADAGTMINDKDTKDFQLVDVRELSEYSAKHLPGSQLIPLGDLKNRIEELDKNKPTILY